ncbi:hypothetical protein P4056_23070, partial [Pseudomonas aeruginosa]|nr:hypothetical protein [Pseudomonas aeruginosa]
QRLRGPEPMQACSTTPAWHGLKDSSGNDQRQRTEAWAEDYPSARTNGAVILTAAWITEGDRLSCW